MNKKFVQAAALCGALAVVLGAFAAHSLKAILSPDTLQIFETAVRYQFYHALALLAVGILILHFPVKQFELAGKLFIAGIILFSGSLYILCYIKHQQIAANWIGAITPLGGICFIAGWAFLFIGANKISKTA